MDPVAVSVNMDYIKGWVAVNKMMHEGLSWSGHERNCCFLNTGGRQFADVSAASGLDFIDDGRALALTDWDHDGDLDLWLVNRTAPQVRFVRNNTSRSNHFLAIRLLGNGRTCNRDAIGARLELHLADGPSSTLVKTLHAGDGFLSQSSKWVHFGLGDSPRLSRLVIKWPDGNVETVTNISADGRYRIEQGTGRATAEDRPDRKITLQPSPGLAHATKNECRILLVGRVPIPDLSYVDLDGQEKLVSSDPSPGRERKPLLINLWAPWCRPCLKELREFSQAADRLHGADLELVAISVEGLDGGAVSREQIRQRLSDLGFPFDAGVAAKGLVAHLDVLHRAVQSKQQALPLPCSMLIDAQGQLAAIYKGPVQLEQLLADVKLLDASADSLRDSAVPFPGRWAARPITPSPLAVALKYIDAGDLEGARKYLDRCHRFYAQRGGRISQMADLHYFLGCMLIDQDQEEDAMQAFREALQANPNYHIAHVDLARGLMRRGDFRTATEHLSKALRIKVDDPLILKLRGSAWLQTGELSRAVADFQAALQYAPSDAQVHFDLGRAFQIDNDAGRAIHHYRIAFKLRPRWAAPGNNLAWLLATHASEKLRNGRQAIDIARRVVQIVGDKDPTALDTLAAAQAEAGQWDDAVQTAGQAVKLARGQEQPELADRIERRRERYRMRLPYRESIED